MLKTNIDYCRKNVDPNQEDVKYNRMIISYIIPEELVGFDSLEMRKNGCAYQ